MYRNYEVLEAKTINLKTHHSIDIWKLSVLRDDG